MTILLYKTINELVLNATVTESDQQEFNIVVEVTDLESNTYTKQFAIYNQVNSTSTDDMNAGLISPYIPIHHQVFSRYRFQLVKQALLCYMIIRAVCCLRKEFSSELTFGSALQKGFYSLVIFTPDGRQQHQIIKE
jgi:hypothetical protein